MAVNKVVFGDKTLIDLTSDTVTPEALLSGYTAHDKSGALIDGTLELEYNLGIYGLVRLNPTNTKYLSISNSHPNISLSISQTAGNVPTAIKVTFYLIKTVISASGGYFDVFLDNKIWKVTSKANVSSGSGTSVPISTISVLGVSYFRFSLTNMPASEIIVQLDFTRI